MWRGGRWTNAIVFHSRGFELSCHVDSDSVLSINMYSSASEIIFALSRMQYRRSEEGEKKKGMKRGRNGSWNEEEEKEGKVEEEED